MADISILVETSFSTPTGGWSVSLIKADPQGINERVLILDVIASPPAPGTIVTQAIQEHNLSYNERMRSGLFYEDVEVRRPDTRLGDSKINK